MTGYEIAPAAEEDLRGIARYTIDTWGLEQAKTYEAALSDCFKAIADGSIRPRVFLKRRPDLLFTLCEHHCVFYRIRKSKRPLIVAVFHERMDLMARLKGRLRKS